GEEDLADLDRPIGGHRGNLVRGQNRGTGDRFGDADASRRRLPAGDFDIALAELFLDEPGNVVGSFGVGPQVFGLGLPIGTEAPEANGDRSACPAYLPEFGRRTADKLKTTDSVHPAIVISTELTFH